MSDLYRIDTKAHDVYDGSYTGGLPDPISFLIDDGVLVLVEPCEHGNYARHIVAGGIVTGDNQWADEYGRVICEASNDD